jgi:hypothetical protein
MSDRNHREAILLKEYEVAQDAVNAQNSTAWQTGSIFVVAGLALQAFVAQTLFESPGNASRESLALLMAIAMVSWGTLYLWYISYRRWGTFVEITHRRMQEIEKELGIWKNRDIELVDMTIQQRDADSPIISDSEQDKIHQAVVGAWANRLNRRERLTALSIHRAIRGIVALALFGWLGMIVFHIPQGMVFFSKWYLIVAVILAPTMWFFYPRIRMHVQERHEPANRGANNAGK